MGRVWGRLGGNEGVRVLAPIRVGGQFADIPESVTSCLSRASEGTWVIGPLHAVVRHRKVNVWVIVHVGWSRVAVGVYRHGGG